MNRGSEELTKRYEAWQQLQPLKPEDQQRLDKKFMLEFNYNSNHLEGNTLTYGQTQLLLLFGETSGDAIIRDYEEMKAHNVALNLIKQEASDKTRPLTESFIREINRIILVEPFWKEAETPDGQPTRIEVKIGVYKSRPNHVRTATGEIFEYASPEETPALMSDLVSWYNQEEEKRELSTIELASLLHYRFIRIHPFEDGNGRIARLLVNYVLLRNDYPMIIIKTEDKENYLRILHQWDIEVGLTPSMGATASSERLKPFIEYLSKQLISSLEIAIKAGKGESIEDSDDWAKKLQWQKQNAEMTPAFSVKAAREIQEKTIYYLAKTIYDKLKEFEPLFDINWLEKNNRVKIKNIEEIKGYPADFDFRNGIHFYAWYKKTILYKDYFFSYSVYCKFSDYSYTIRLETYPANEFQLLTKKYNQQITDGEVEEFLNFTGQQFEKFVSKYIIKADE